VLDPQRKFYTAELWETTPGSAGAKRMEEYMRGEMFDQHVKERHE